MSSIPRCKPLEKKCRKGCRSLGHSLVGGNINHGKSLLGPVWLKKKINKQKKNSYLEKLSKMGPSNSLKYSRKEGVRSVVPRANVQTCPLDEKLQVFKNDFNFRRKNSRQARSGCYNKHYQEGKVIGQKS
jgi:hypothetical protein